MSAAVLMGSWPQVSISPRTNTISVYNDGAAIPVELHKVEKIYVPELVFGHLLTSR